jgi:hypothetical protein
MQNAMSCAYRVPIVCLGAYAYMAVDGGGGGGGGEEEEEEKKEEEEKRDSSSRKLPPPEESFSFSIKPPAPRLLPAALPLEKAMSYFRNSAEGLGFRV